MKNKTLATWLTFLGGPLGLHRFYLHGWGDLLGWALPIPTALGLYGVERVREFGIDDHLSWLLLPVLSFTIAGCALRGILYGLLSAERWNARFNPYAARDARAGDTNWLTVLGMATTLLVGSAALGLAIVMSEQHFFEYQLERSQERLQGAAPGSFLATMAAPTTAG